MKKLNCVVACFILAVVIFGETEHSTSAVKPLGENEIIFSLGGHSDNVYAFVQKPYGQQHWQQLVFSLKEYGQFGLEAEIYDGTTTKKFQATARLSPGFQPDLLQSQTGAVPQTADRVEMITADQWPSTRDGKMMCVIISLDQADWVKARIVKIGNPHIPKSGDDIVDRNNRINGLRVAQSLEEG